MDIIPADFLKQGFFFNKGLYEEMVLYDDDKAL
jgi:hypothetical protein